MPPNRFESEVESFLEGSHGDRTHIKRADHHTVTPLCGTLLRWANFFALTPTIGPRRANYFAHRTQRRGGSATNDTSAATDAGQHETTIATARPRTATIETGGTSATEKRTKCAHFSPAKAMTVSTGPPHGPAKAKPVSVKARPAQAKATRVSDNHTPG